MSDTSLKITPDSPAAPGNEAAQQVALRRSQSLATLVLTEIERMILERVLAPDTRSNEQTLAQPLAVSRGPVREACRNLQASGLVESKPNRGFFVRVLS